MSDTIWAAIITSFTALIIAIGKGIYDLKKIQLQSKTGIKGNNTQNKFPSSKFSKYLFQTQKIPIFIFLILLITLVIDFINYPNPLTVYFLFAVVLKMVLIFSIILSILIFYLIRLISGSLKD